MRTRTRPLSRARVAGLDAVRGALFGANDNLKAAVRVRGAKGRISAS